MQFPMQFPLDPGLCPWVCPSWRCGPQAQSFFWGCGGMSRVLRGAEQRPQPQPRTPGAPLVCQTQTFPDTIQGPLRGRTVEGSNSFLTKLLQKGNRPAGPSGHVPLRQRPNRCTHASQTPRRSPRVRRKGRRGRSQAEATRHWETQATALATVGGEDPPKRVCEHVWWERDWPHPCFSKRNWEAPLVKLYSWFRLRS